MNNEVISLKKQLAELEIQKCNIEQDVYKIKEEYHRTLVNEYYKQEDYNTILEFIRGKKLDKITELGYRYAKFKYKGSTLTSIVNEKTSKVVCVLNWNWGPNYQTFYFPYRWLNGEEIEFVIEEGNDNG